LRGRSVDDDPGEGLVAECCDLDWDTLTATVPADDATPLPGGRLSRVVLDRLTDSLCLEDLEGVRCEVERSKAGLTAIGGEGAGRKAEGAGALGLGGGGGERW